MDTHRGGEIGNFVPCRSARVQCVDGQWYFYTREDERFGPYLNQQQAGAAVAEYIELKIIQRQAVNKPGG